MIDIKAIKAAAEAATNAKHIATADPATVIALCDEIERLRTALEQPAQKTCGRCVVFCQGGEGCHCNAPQISQRGRERLVSDQLNRRPAVEPTCKAGLQVHKTTGWVAHKDQYAAPVLFNPYTGEPRDVRDVQSDPQGILIVPPGKVEMLVAKPAPAERTVQEQQPVAWASQTAIDIAAEGGEGIIVGAEADCLIPLYAVPQPAPAERTVQEPVCRGCGIPANDLHMSTCPTKKWPMRVTPADAAPQAHQPVAEVAWDGVNLNTLFIRFLPAGIGLSVGTRLYTAPPAEPAVKLYDHGPQAETVAEALRDVSKWLNERPNRPLDLRHVAMLCAAFAEPALVQEPVAWWKQYPDGNVSVVGGKVFLTEDALYRGWRPLGFADAAPADVPLKPNGDDE